VSEVVERVVHGLRVVIDRELCVGFGDCVKEAPEGFELDADNIAVFRNPDTVEREQLLRACDACPVDAITVWDAAGRQLVPAPEGSAADT
jgi:ferredoxin